MTSLFSMKVRASAKAFPTSLRTAYPMWTRALASLPSSMPADYLKDIADRALVAQSAFLKLEQEHADHIFNKVAREANKQRLPLAKLAYNETQLGCFEDKVLKNGVTCELVQYRYKDTKTCGLIEVDREHGKYTYATPAGPVCAVTPVTNPTSTAIAKSLFMAKTRNAGIFLPHPSASNATAEAVRICREAGEMAGAPADWLQCVEHPTMDMSEAIMKSDGVRMIVSTGGPGVVRASYTSGKPAIGVGGGNAPILVDELADLPAAVGSIVQGKTFDYGVICAAEQSAVVVEQAYAEFVSLLRARGAHILNKQDRDRLAAFMYKGGHINKDVVGQPPSKIAKLAGLKEPLPSGTVLLATEEGTDYNPSNPMTKEKLSPVIALFRAKDFDTGLDMCQTLASNGGIGHTGGMYTEKTGTLSPRAHAYAAKVPVGRVIVNAPTSLTAIGTSFNFATDPSFSLGVGTHAGSSVSGNLTPMHLVNTSTVVERQEHMEWFNLPRKIFFNRGCLEEGLAEIATPDAHGNREKRALVVTDKGMVACGHADRVSKALKKLGFVVGMFEDVHPDPDMECVRKGVAACESFKPDVMIALGGGSPIDAAKFIRVQYEHPEITCEEASTRFLEIRKRTNPFPRLGSKVHEFVVIPTTSGTGSEVSPFTVITDDNGIKHPLASYKMTPDISICDSTLCDGIPKPLVANAGIDAVTHAVEAYVSVVSHPMAESHALEAVRLLFENLPTSYGKGTPASRDAVHKGATLAGIAFSNAFLGVCHSLAHQVGAEFHLPHGLTCAILLQHVIRYNACDNPTRMGIYPSYTHPKATKKYCDLARAIGAKSETPEGLIDELKKLMTSMDMPLSFKDAGIDPAQFKRKISVMAERAFDDQCTPANPRFPLVPELEQVLLNAFEGDSK